MNSKYKLWGDRESRSEGQTYVTYSYACRNIFNTIKTSGHSSLEKYTSHFIRKGDERVCVRGELETEQRLQHIEPPPSSSGYSSISFPFSWGPSLCCELVLTPRTGTTDFKLWSPTNRTSVAPGYIIVWHPPASCGVTIRTQFNPSTVKVIPPWYLRPDAPVTYTGAFLIWQLGRVVGQYVTPSVNLQEKDKFVFWWIFLQECTIAKNES